MTIEKIYKIAKILLIVCFFIPLIGIFADVYNLYFVYSDVPVLTGTSILLAMYNTPLFLLALAMYALGTALEVRSKMNISAAFYIISSLVSVGSILLVIYWLIPWVLG